MLLILVFLGCNSKEHSANNNDTILRHGNETASLSYPGFLKQVAIKRGKLKNAPTNKAGNYLFSIFNNDIPHYWTGTPWDFNGTTRIPGQGNIACGYFVTNTLSDIGFNIQRVKLAQQASSYMIKTLCVNVKTISGFQQFKNYINTQPANSIFIIGLDFHTGFILKDDKQSYFLHSNYINRQGVIKETMDNSKALANSKVFVVGGLSQNKALLQNWVNH